MCTLIVAFTPGAEAPLVVGANRDERLARPASPPFVWPEGFLAPRDDEAGGTWLGVTREGMFVGVTNRFGAPRDPARASRGALVVEALAAGTAARARALFDALAASRFNPFHLLYADPDEGHVTWSDGDQVRHERLTPGLHVVTERSLGGDDRARAERVRDAFGRRPLEDVLRQHGPDGDPLAGTCVHVPALGYGTRSSLVLTIARDRARSQMSWAEGSPCTHPFEDRSSLLRDLFR